MFWNLLLYKKWSSNPLVKWLVGSDSIEFFYCFIFCFGLLKTSGVYLSSWPTIARSSLQGNEPVHIDVQALTYTAHRLLPFTSPYMDNHFSVFLNMYCFCVLYCYLTIAKYVTWNFSTVSKYMIQFCQPCTCVVRQIPRKHPPQPCITETP